MTPSDMSPNTEDILKNPAVARVTDRVNPQLTARRSFVPPVCGVFEKPCSLLRTDESYRFTIDQEAEKQLSRIIANRVQVVEGTDAPDDALKAQYTRRRNIGIVFSGGPAPGGHNVIAGLFDAARRANPANKVFGFILGPDGIIENEAVELTGEMVDAYRNLGGFTMIRTGRTKIDTKEKMRLSRETCKALKLDALVVVGGDDSNTNAAFLAQEMYEDGVQVIGVPKTIDGDIQVRDDTGRVLCAMSFGFHTAARSFAGAISNLCTDGSSDVKYWHICKVMGRVASHLALEVALQTHASMTFIGEDLADFVDRKRLEKAEAEGTVDYTAYGMTLRHLSRVICDGIVRRAAVGKTYGVMVIPEGVLEFINEIQIFIIKLNTIIAEYNDTHDKSFHQDFPLLPDKLEYLRKLLQLSQTDPAYTIWNSRDNELFNDIPGFFQEGLLMERDSHGNFPFSQVRTEKVLLGLVQDYLNYLKEQGIYKVGIRRDYYSKTLRSAGLDPDFYGPALFRNYADGKFLQVRPVIISRKTLIQALEKGGAIQENQEIPPVIEKIFKKSVPDFKTQTHFYGYDGRGGDPTRFDCTYTYNLGQTVFSLVANGATGQMAAIRNLEFDFSRWEPIGIPIAPLMHLEERKGRLALVIEKSVVDVSSVAFRAVKALREKWLAASDGPDDFRRPGPVSLFSDTEESHPITLTLNATGRTAR
ncbi:phosphofructokinase [Desulfonema ishimotonii]|uniref:Phosphofructokinase n=1 Tax=Desulfonema ishimotonii TaxID=45657 RepID=A0A401FZ37_9BACT|nr:6-phosphofructokinase [Desulfonema ishimotonii]GBC62241.1 phosphofructokinase [Desulfonema ishimotonii]